MGISKRSLSHFFDLAGVPLVNNRWSWGAISEDCVILRVWQDEKLEGRFAFVVRFEREFLKDRRGYKERERHFEEIRSGKPCFLKVCIAKNPNIDPRSIDSVVSDVFVAGELIEVGEETVLVNGNNCENGSLAITWHKRWSVKKFLDLKSRGLLSECASSNEDKT